MLYTATSGLQKLMGTSLQSGMAVVLVEDEERMQSMVGSIEDAANNPDATARGTSMARRIVIPTLSYSVAFYAAVVSLLLR